MKHNFKGWSTVFAFTFRQATKGVRYKLFTILITVLILAACILVNIFTANPDTAKETEPSPIKTVYLSDNSGLQPTDYKSLSPLLNGNEFKDVEFIYKFDQSREEIIQTASSDSTEAIAIIITSADEGYKIEAIIPDGSTITRDQAQALLEPVTSGFETSKLKQAGLTTNQLTVILKPVAASYSDIGDNTSMIVSIIKMAAPMLFGLILYIMLILYGQTVSNSVSTEKTSKLMETLLTSIHPYALITGKILAITSMALIQFITWIIAAFIGLYGGNAIAHTIYPGYKNSAIHVIHFLRDNIGETAMTLPSVVLAILIFTVGFLFYCVIAGLAGCMISKPEDASSTQGIFTLPIVISWLVCYFASLIDNEGVLKAARLIPFTIPFCTPVDLITGTIGLLQGIISLLILLIFTFITIMLSGKIYKGLILYSGQKVTFSIIGKIVKTNR